MLCMQRVPASVSNISESDWKGLLSEFQGSFYQSMQTMLYWVTQQKAASCASLCRPDAFLVFLLGEHQLAVSELWAGFTVVRHGC